MRIANLTIDEGNEKGRVNETSLKQLIEPLAGYICAVEHPKAALVWALVILFDEVDQNNRASQCHIAVMSESNMG